MQPKYRNKLSSKLGCESAGRSRLAEAELGTNALLLFAQPLVVLAKFLKAHSVLVDPIFEVQHDLSDAAHSPLTSYASDARCSFPELPTLVTSGVSGVSHWPGHASLLWEPPAALVETCFRNQTMCNPHAP